MSQVHVAISALEQALAALLAMEQSFEVGVCVDNIRAILEDVNSIAS